MASNMDVSLKIDTEPTIAKRKLSDDFSEAIEDVKGGDTLEKSTMRRVAWRILPLFCTYHFIGQLQKRNLSFASQGLKDDLQLSDSQYGTVVSAFLFAYAAATIPNTLLAKRVGAKYALPSMMFVMGILTLCTAFVSNYAGLLSLRVLLGISVSGVIQVGKIEYHRISLILLCYATSLSHHSCIYLLSHTFVCKF